MRSQQDMSLHIGNANISHNTNNQTVTKTLGSKQDNLLHVGNLSILQKTEKQIITSDMRSQQDMTLHVGNAVFAHNINILLSDKTQIAQ